MAPNKITVFKVRELKNYFFFVIILVVFCSGCQSVPPLKSQTENHEEMQDVIGSIAEAVSGRELSEEEKQNLQKQIRTDPETQSAIEEIKDSMSGRPVWVKYCPVTGRRYSFQMLVCPTHGVELLEVK